MAKFEILRGNLEVIVLSLFKEAPTHGYRVGKIILKKYGTSFGPSTIYPMLIGFEKKGWLTSKWLLNGEKPEKQYTITPAGLQHLQSLRTEYQIFVADFLKVEA